MAVIQSCSTLPPGPVVFLWMLLAVLMSTDWHLSVKCLSMSEFTNMFYKQRSTHPHGGVNYKLVRKISISKFVFFIPSSYIHGGEKILFLITSWKNCKHTCRSLSQLSLFSQKYHRFLQEVRVEALTSNKHIIFWACKPTHGDDKLSAQVQCSHFQLISKFSTHVRWM